MVTIYYTEDKIVMFNSTHINMEIVLRGNAHSYVVFEFKTGVESSANNLFNFQNLDIN